MATIRPSFANAAEFFNSLLERKLQSIPLRRKTGCYRRGDVLSCDRLVFGTSSRLQWHVSFVSASCLTLYMRLSEGRVLPREVCQNQARERGLHVRLMVRIQRGCGKPLELFAIGEIISEERSGDPVDTGPK
ncbi:hypothetical protein A1D31_37690 [Bradyrhizobium liaoningense]|nr:hypothetical protein A1D31_37690 [Bradyrhizobium liaoningense]